jgi:phosphomannomutase
MLLAAKNSCAHSAVNCLQGCAAGVVVTASHNPAMYNGFKVYWSNACQIIPPHDAGIAAAIEGELALWQVPPLESIDYSHPLVQDPLQQVADAYYARLKRHVQFRDAEANGVAPRMVYTALHGVGTPWVLRAFQEFALPPPLLVRQQCDPDADFPTVAFPNPEEGEGAWALAFEAAEAAGASLALANDPDADRFAVAERDQATGDCMPAVVRRATFDGRLRQGLPHCLPCTVRLRACRSLASCGAGRWRAFTGNEIGAMLAEWVVRNHRQRHGHPDDKLAVLSSTVSSRMLQALAAKEGAYWAETLTGGRGAWPVAWSRRKSLHLGLPNLKLSVRRDDACWQSAILASFGCRCRVQMAGQ